MLYPYDLQHRLNAILTKFTSKTSFFSFFLFSFYFILFYFIFFTLPNIIFTNNYISLNTLPLLHLNIIFFLLLKINPSKNQIVPPIDLNRSNTLSINCKSYSSTNRSTHQQISQLKNHHLTPNSSAHRLITIASAPSTRSINAPLTNHYIFVDQFLRERER